MDKRNKIVILIYSIFSAFLIISSAVQCAIDREVHTFSILLLILTIASFVLMILNLKITKRWFTIVTDVAVPISLMWNVGFIIACIVLYHNSLFFTIFNAVLVFILGALIVVKIILEVIEIHKNSNTPIKKRRNLTQDQIIATIEKLKELHDNNILTDEEYEENRKKYVKML